MMIRIRTHVHTHMHTHTHAMVRTHPCTPPPSEILPVTMNREKAVPGLFRRSLFLVSAKKKVTCLHGIGEDLGTTWGPFKWENLRTWGPFKWENLRERTHPPTPLIHTQDQWEELQPMKVARTGLGVSSLQVHHICEIHSCSTCACNRAGILSFENFCQRLLYAVQSRLNHTH